MEGSQGVQSTATIRRKQSGCQLIRSSTKGKGLPETEKDRQIFLFLFTLLLITNYEELPQPHMNTKWSQRNIICTSTFSTRPWGRWIITDVELPNLYGILDTFPGIVSDRYSSSPSIFTFSLLSPLHGTMGKEQWAQLSYRKIRMECVEKWHLVRVS